MADVDTGLLTPPETADPQSSGGASDEIGRSKNRAATFLTLSTVTTPGPLIAFSRSLLSVGVVVPLIPLAREMLARWPKNERVLSLHDDLAARATKMENDGTAASDKTRSILKIRKAIGDVRKSEDPLRLMLASELAIRTYPDESWALENLLRVLNRADQFGWALQEFQGARPSAKSTCDVLYQVYIAALRLDSPKIAATRAAIFERIAVSDQSDLWEARVHRLENDPDRAMAAFARAAEAHPDDLVAAREAASFSLAMGQAGKYAAHILKAEATASPALRAAIKGARELFEAAGGSIEKAAAGEEPSVSVSSPATAFDLLCSDTSINRYEPRSSLMMVGGSLAAGGAERILSTLFAEYRQARGIDTVKLVLFEFSENTPSAFYLPQAGIDPSEILIGRVARATEPKLLWLPKPMAIRAQGIYDHIVAAKPAVLHATLDMANVCAAYAAIRAGVPRIVMHVHNMRPTDLAVAGAYNPDFDHCYRALLSRPDVHLVAVSQATLDDYLDWLGIEPNERTHVIHNGFDFADFDQGRSHEAAIQLRQDLGIGADAPLIGTAFRFAELKRPDWWVEIAAKVAARHPDAHFIMFGDGDLLDDTRALAAKLGMDKRIHFPGRVTNLSELIGALDLFMLTSRTEGLPNVLIEAQAAGVPVTSFDVGGARDTFADGVTGRLVAEQSVDAMAAAVCDLLQSPDRLKAAGEAAAGYVRERFPVARMVDDLAAVLDATTSIPSE